MRDVQAIMVRAAIDAGMPKSSAEHIASGALHFLRQNLTTCTAHYPAVGRAMLRALEEAAAMACEAEAATAPTIPPGGKDEPKLVHRQGVETTEPNGAGGRVLRRPTKTSPPASGERWSP